MKKFLPILIFTGFLIIPVLASATAPEVLRAGMAFSDLIAYILKLGGWMFSILAMVSAVVIIWGAAEFIFSGGDPERVKSGKNKIVFAIIGFVISIAARGMVELVQSFFKIP